MRILACRRFVLLASLSLSLLVGSVREASAQAKAQFTRVQIPTFDGMELGGTFYPSAPAGGKKDKDAVVMLLHDFTHRGGGGSHKDGWDNLAAKLQQEGYSVLQFDFRGFGDSKAVGAKFWKYKHNQMLRAFRGGVKPAKSIDQKDFPSQYYGVLVNDIVAARAYLDNRNDARDVNTSNLIVIGGGDGAALGAMWMGAEMRRQRDKESDRLPVGRNPRLSELDEPEGKDFAAAIWLTINPSVAGRGVSHTIRSSLVDVAQKGKVPTFFFYGKNDDKASNLTLNYIKAIQTQGGKTVEMKESMDKPVPGTELAGGKLLGERLRTTSLLVKELNKVMEGRGKVWRKREEEKHAYCWSMPWPSANNVHKVLAKMPGDSMSYPIPPSVLKFAP
jgi:hypothetical protein